MALVFVATDWFVDGGAYLAHFGESWRSHFGGTKSFAYGSASEHSFDWRLLLKNWDMTLPALFGVGVLIKGWRQRPLLLLPLAWLVLSLTVFSIHKPWWAYYYIHIALPLCWCGAIGIHWAYSRLRLSFSSRRPGQAGSAALLWRGAPFVLVVICMALWMSARVYLQIAGVRKSPQLYSALVLKEIDRLKPYAHWIYTDELAYSFHADIPMPPPLAVVPLKRLWAGEMNNERIAAEMEHFKPELILLRNTSGPAPFQTLIDEDYRLIYQDSERRLYGLKTTLKRAAEAEQSEAQSRNVSSVSVTNGAGNFVPHEEP